MLKESSHTATLVPGQCHQESKPEVLTAAAEANVSTLGLPEVSGKGSSTSEAEDGAVPKPDGAAEVAFVAGGECSELYGAGPDPPASDVLRGHVPSDLVSLQLDGITLHNFAKIKNIPGLVEDPSSGGRRPLDPDDAYNGLDCSSLAFLNVVMQGDDIVGE
ncbi:hypothetical protein HPB52_004958 [Rhipicephalus sanguineus]|uniref:Uncharacterized protein n=1 Tax=Rhipicephalus sanguineus TaxID=34632 RepID=A0A9D4PKT7_RHISA|nr:hypothetical protein HPB52_004958 [Rhipicephalus sanguineus]